MGGGVHSPTSTLISTAHYLAINIKNIQQAEEGKKNIENGLKRDSGKRKWSFNGFHKVLGSQSSKTKQSFPAWRAGDFR